MFERKPKLKALSGAEKVITAREKVAKAIKDEEGKLLKLIQERVDADRALIAAETAAALGEQSDVTGARQKADNALAVIRRQASTLGGLRARLAGMATDLETQVRAVQAALPGHVETLKAGFTEEWREGLAVFAALLGKRQALEALVGKFDLPAPQPSACDLGDTAAPWAAIDALKSALTEIAGWNNAASAPLIDAMGPGGLQSFDRQAVYTLLRPCDALPAGTLVMEPSFVPGFLQHLVNIQYAAVLTSQDWAASLEAGARAARALDSEAQSEAWRAAEAQENAARLANAKIVPLSEQRPAREDKGERQRFELTAEQLNNSGPAQNVGTMVI